MSFLDGLREHKDTLLRGVTLIVGGAALVLVGTFVGIGTSKLAMVSAGTIAVTGVVVMFLGFFVYILPPLLPSR